MIVSKFDSVQDLNGYLDHMRQHPQIIHVNSVELLFAVENVEVYNNVLRSYISGEHSLTEFNLAINSVLESTDQVSIYNDKYIQYDKNLYIYPWSKTIYRRTIHANVVDSIYKKMYNLLKTVDYITAATGSYTIFKHVPVTEEQFNSVFGQVESFDEKTIQNIITSIQELSSDKAFYLQVISNLENKVYELENEKDKLLNQVNNKYLTTWY